jgi:hypothetical protein
MAKSKKRVSRRRRFTIPLAVVGGMIPVAVGVWDRRSSGTAMAAYLQQGFTGISPGGGFNISNFRVGLFPVMGGFIVHTIASKLGVNRALARAGLPIIRV